MKTVQVNGAIQLKPDGKFTAEPDETPNAGYGWLFICVFGMISTLTIYGIVLEYATSGGRVVHEISFLFVTCTIYAITAYVGRYLQGETPTQIPKYRMLILSLTSVASTFTSVRSLRYVIFPVQILVKSCKPVPVLLFGLVLGKRYPLRKYVNVAIITAGVALFMGGGHSASKTGSSSTTIIGGIILLCSLCFDGATGAYEDKLMSKDHVEPFDLMFNIQVGKCSIAFLALIILNQLHEFLNMISEMGWVLVLLGLTGALGQIFVFITISKFGALNCAIIGLIRKILSLICSFVLYSHPINAVQLVGLVLALSAMVANFREKKEDKVDHHHDAGNEDRHNSSDDDEKKKLIDTSQATSEGGEGMSIEMVATNPSSNANKSNDNDDHHNNELYLPSAVDLDQAIKSGQGGNNGQSGANPLWNDKNTV